MNNPCFWPLNLRMVNPCSRLKRWISHSARLRSNVLLSALTVRLVTWDENWDLYSSRNVCRLYTCKTPFVSTANRRLPSGVIRHSGERSWFLVYKLVHVCNGWWGSWLWRVHKHIGDLASWLDVANRVESGHHDADVGAWPLSAELCSTSITIRPVVVFHTRALPSLQHVMIFWSSGLQVTNVTSEECFSSLWSIWKLVVS